MESLSAPLAVPVVRPPAVALRLATDARLMRWAAAGSEGAMAVIFERHHQALHRYCHSLVGNGHDAADALQNTMVKALRALPGERRHIELRPWLYRIAHNESISLLRARHSDSDLSAAVDVSDVPAGDAVESRERLRSLTEDLGELTERQRSALLMRELSGLEFTEVADALGTSAAAVKQTVYEARCALQAMQEGRAMNCETVRRMLSDGDRRMLSGMRMRGHLRACAGCSDFQAAMHQRPSQLSAMVPPLPLAVAAAMLHGIVGGTGTGGGGGFAAGIAGTAKATTGLSLGAKAAAIVATSAALAGGAVYAVPELKSISPQRSTPGAERVDAAKTPGAMPTAASVASGRASPGASAATRSSRDRSAAGTAQRAGDPAGAGKAAGAPGGKAVGAPGGKPADTHGGKPAGTPGGKPADTHGGKPADTHGGKPAGTHGGKPAGTPGGLPAGTPGVGIANTLGASADAAHGGH